MSSWNFPSILVARSQYVPRTQSSRVTSLYLSYPKTSASTSLTITEVSDSFTSRDFAPVRMGWYRFKPTARRSATFDAMAIDGSLDGGHASTAVRHLSRQAPQHRSWNRVAGVGEAPCRRQR